MTSKLREIRNYIKASDIDGIKTGAINSAPMIATFNYCDCSRRKE